MEAVPTRMPYISMETSTEVPTTRMSYIREHYLNRRSYNSQIVHDILNRVCWFPTKEEAAPIAYGAHLTTKDGISVTYWHKLNGKPIDIMKTLGALFWLAPYFNYQNIRDDLFYHNEEASISVNQSANKPGKFRVFKQTLYTQGVKGKYLVWSKAGSNKLTWKTPTEIKSNWKQVVELDPKSTNIPLTLGGEVLWMVWAENGAQMIEKTASSFKHESVLASWVESDRFIEEHVPVRDINEAELSQTFEWMREDYKRLKSKNGEFLSLSNIGTSLLEVPFPSNQLQWDCFLLKHQEIALMSHYILAYLIEATEHSALGQQFLKHITRYLNANAAIPLATGPFSHHLLLDASTQLNQCLRQLPRTFPSNKLNTQNKWVINSKLRLDSSEDMTTLKTHIYSAFLCIYLTGWESTLNSLDKDKEDEFNKNISGLLKSYATCYIEKIDSANLISAVKDLEEIRTQLIDHMYLHVKDTNSEKLKPKRKLSFSTQPFSVSKPSDEAIIRTYRQSSDYISLLYLFGLNIEGGLFRDLIPPAFSTTSIEVEELMPALPQSSEPNSLATSSSTDSANQPFSQSLYPKITPLNQPVSQSLYPKITPPNQLFSNSLYPNTPLPYPQFLEAFQPSAPPLDETDLKDPPSPFELS